MNIPRQWDGPKIRQLRIEQGMSADEFGHKTGVHPQHLRRTERNEGGASLDTLLRIADGLGVDLVAIVRPGTPLHTALTRAEASGRRRARAAA